MPVSTPSYFPPNRSNGSVVGITAGLDFTGARGFIAGQDTGNFSDLNDCVLIGDHIMTAGVTDAHLAGSTVVGSQALKSLIGIDTAGRSPVGNTVMGFNALNALQYGGANVVIGQQAAQFVVGAISGSFAQNTLVGALAASNLTGVSSTQNVVIGFAAANSATEVNAVIGGCVIIGAEAMNTVAGGQSIQDTVIIGRNAGAAVGSGVLAVQQLTLVGSACAPNLSGSTRSVFLGADQDGPGESDDCVTIGAIAGYGGGQCVVIGSQACNGGSINTPGGRSTVLGFGAGSTHQGAIPADSFIVETWDGSTLRSLLFGNQAQGSLIVGNSVGASRDLAAIAGTNILKIQNGAIGGTNPTGGGYFYVAAGALHWVGSAGTDTTVAPA